MQMDNFSISLIENADAIKKILRKFPTVIGIFDPTPGAKHIDFHDIDTQGPPVAQKAQSLTHFFPKCPFFVFTFSCSNSM